eukprot:SAG22_NODE_505_length_9680_cov_10.482831_11_plen_355_part_00
MDSAVCFHNTMVDRVVTHRLGDPMVPKAEPLPAKAIVCEDLGKVLPAAFGRCTSVVVRTEAGELALDLALKLRILNGTHTAMVYLMALSRLPMTTDCIGHQTVLPYLHHLFESDIVAMVTTYAGTSINHAAIESVFTEWITRLTHPEFGLSCFWVSQNAGEKLGIRFIPTVLSVLEEGRMPSHWMAFAVAAMLRFLTPTGGTQPPGKADDDGGGGGGPPVFTGTMDEARGGGGGGGSREEYVPGLGFDLAAGRYEFRDGDGILPRKLQALVDDAETGGTCTPEQVGKIVGKILLSYPGVDGADGQAVQQFVNVVADILRRMLPSAAGGNGERAMDVLAAMLADSSGGGSGGARL